MKLLPRFAIIITVIVLDLLFVSFTFYVSAANNFLTPDKAEKMLEGMTEAEKSVKDKMKQSRGGSINSEHLWMDGLADDAEMNCPSFKWTDSADFNPPKNEVTTSLRCATCNLMKEFMIRRARMLVLRGRRPSAAYVLEGDNDGTKSSLNGFAGKPFCEGLHDSYQLREKADGERVWVRRFENDEDAARFGSGTKSLPPSSPSSSKESPEERNKKSLEADRLSLMKTHLVSTAVNSELDEATELFPVKMHTPQQRRTLPCSRYFLKQLCFAELEAHEEHIDNCFDGVFEHIHRLKASSRNTNKENPDQIWVDVLDRCLGKALVCERKFCNSKAVANARAREWLQFAWYEGAFGNPKFSYIPDLEKKGRNMLNPYRKGGEKENANPYLNGTWKQVETPAELFGGLHGLADL